MNYKKYTPNDYLSAAKSRFYDCNHLKENDNCIIFAIYSAGVSIECVLRAHITKYTKEFDSKHDLKKLFLKSLIIQKLSNTKKEKAISFIKIANELWSNDLRYYSEKRMKRILAHKFVSKNTKILTNL